MTFGQKLRCATLNQFSLAQPFASATSLRIISGPTAARVNFTRCSCGRLRNALTELLKYAAVMCKTTHRANSYHFPLVAKFAAYRA